VPKNIEEAVLDQPNILWYCTDQQRFDTIHSMGNPHIHTPNIDQLVERGVAFENAYTQCPICTPSRATFLTGQYPATHHVHRNGNEFFSANGKLVTKIFAESGYDCGLVGKLHLARSQDVVEKRTDDGYRFFKWSHHPQPDWIEGHDYADWLETEKGVDPEELYKDLRGVPYSPGVPAEYHQTTWCTEMALNFLNEKRDGPWLLSINPFDPHPPFNPPQSFIDRYNPEELPYPLFKDSDLERQKAFANVDQQTVEAYNPYSYDTKKEHTAGQKTADDAASNPPGSYDARLIKAYYYAMIELLDEQFGRIVSYLDETGQLENTIIIFTSDHGELLGDHGLIYKGCRFFEGLVHVPMIISWPERLMAGLKSKALVELVDLPPTLLEAAGLETPYYMQGKSLVSLMKGERNLDYHKQYVISEFNDAIDLPDASHGTMYFDGRYKSIMYHDRSLGELFDLETDPGEFDNLWDKPEHSQLKTELLAKHFNAMMMSSSAGVQRMGQY
jgi:arylsulfatase